MQNVNLAYPAIIEVRILLFLSIQTLDFIIFTLRLIKLAPLLKLSK